MARTVSATLAMIMMSYFAIPHIVSAASDNRKLQHQLQLQSVELSEAKAEINQLRYRAMQPGMLTEDDSPRVAQRGHRPPLVGTAPLPDAITAAAAAFTNPQCREEWLARRRRDAAPSALPSAHPEPLPFAGGNLVVPGVLEAALEARAPAKELIFLSVGDTRDHRREIKDPVRAPRCRPPALLLLSCHRARRRPVRCPVRHHVAPHRTTPRLHRASTVPPPYLHRASTAGRCAPHWCAHAHAHVHTCMFTYTYACQALRTISVDFLLNLLANLKQLGIGHYLILTTEPLCRKLQQEHCEAACVWTELWHEHPGLSPWGLKAGDMFLMWAQQWRYICRAMELGYRVLRADTDVYLAEDPYPLLRGPLFSQFQMVRLAPAPRPDPPPPSRPASRGEAHRPITKPLAQAPPPAHPHARPLRPAPTRWCS